MDSKLIVGGKFLVSVNGEPLTEEPNIVVDEGINYLLSAGLTGGSQLSALYIALFSGNVTPASTWTAANFTANSTEFVNYDESARQAWTHGSVASKSVDNIASKAVFTISTGGGTVYGAALISTSTKSATTGTLIASARFTSSRVLSAGDLLNVAYTISGSST